MKKYRVNVNGTVYEVEIEDISGAAPAAPAPAPAAAPSAAPSGGEAITSPMPGNILAVNVQPGNAVKKGQVLMILEAMKMENEIMCPRDGKVVSVAVNKGAAVDSGAEETCPASPQAQSSTARARSRKREMSFFFMVFASYASGSAISWERLRSTSSRITVS